MLVEPDARQEGNDGGEWEGEEKLSFFPYRTIVLTLKLINLFDCNWKSI